MDTIFYVPHAVMFIYDPAEAAQENDWTMQHVAQGFSRRPTTMNLTAAVKEAGRIVEFDTSPELLAMCAWKTSFSLLTHSGRIEFSGGEPDGEVVWEGRPGWTRVTVGQRVLRDANTPDLLVVVTIAEASGEEPTVVERDGVRLSGELLETAEPYVAATLP